MAIATCTGQSKGKFGASVLILNCPLSAAAQRRDRAATAVMGSSLGGPISLYLG
jgi:hypothetical protein